jgi:hypothetical protein
LVHHLHSPQAFIDKRLDSTKNKDIWGYIKLALPAKERYKNRANLSKAMVGTQLAEAQTAEALDKAVTMEWLRNNGFNRIVKYDAKDDEKIVATYYIKCITDMIIFYKQRFDGNYEPHSKMPYNQLSEIDKQHLKEMAL